MFKSHLIIKRIIIILLLVHSIAVFIWSMKGLSLHNFANQFPDTGIQNRMEIKLLSEYINLTGSDQYWDFFASDTYKYHKSLVVCDKIDFPDSSQQIECTGNTLYQSYDSDLASVFQHFNGNRNRSYRFTEQLITLNQEWAFDQFLQYWARNDKISSSGFLYLISQLRPIKSDAAESIPINRLVWVIKR